MLDGVPLADQSVLEAIAERVTDNVRSLEGALIRVVAYHSLTGRPIDLELTSTVLDTMYPSRGRRAALDRADPGPGGRALRACRVRPPLRQPHRPDRVAPAGGDLSVAASSPARPLQAIGEAFGGRNHATVLHACKRVSDRLASDQNTEAELQSAQDPQIAGDQSRPELLTDSFARSRRELPR